MLIINIVKNMCKFAKATSVYIIIENTRVYCSYYLYTIYNNNNNNIYSYCK